MISFPSWKCIEDNGNFNEKDANNVLPTIWFTTLMCPNSFCKSLDFEWNCTNLPCENDQPPSEQGLVVMDKWIHS
jgi:hypothetical protein